MSDTQIELDRLKANIYDHYRDGRIPRDVAVDLLGEADLQTAEENDRAAAKLFSGDTSRFIVGEE